MSFDQAYRLRQLARPADDPRGNSVRWAPLVVVSGGKGGVGTSTVALELARSVTHLGCRATLVEADLDHGGRLSPPPDSHTIDDCLAARQSVRQALEPGPDDIWVLHGSWAPPEIVTCAATAQDRLIGQLRELSANCDVVIIDAGSSRNGYVRRFWRAASMVVMVATPERQAVMESYAAIKVLLAGDTSIPVYTLVNFATDAASTLLVHERVRATCKRFLGLRTSPLGEVPAAPTRPGLYLSDPASDHDTARLFAPLGQSMCDELGIFTTRHTSRRLAA